MSQVGWMFTMTIIKCVISKTWTMAFTKSKNFRGDLKVARYLVCLTSVEKTLLIDS